MFGRSSSAGAVEPGERDTADHAGTTVVDGSTVDGAVDGAGRDDGERTRRIMVSPRGAAAAETVPVEAARWVHASLLATLSLVIGVLAVAATLTGLLAPLGFAAGVLAVILGVLALPAVRRRHVSGHGLLGAGILLGLVAIVLSLLAINGELSWLSNRADEIATVHGWLDDHMHWLRRW